MGYWIVYQELSGGARFEIDLERTLMHSKTVFPLDIVYIRVRLSDRCRDVLELERPLTLLMALV